ncbi:trans-sialidase [Trypanosoma cruzi Dm28c]|uniref:Trans-sialidase n=1 Tax=Trypanosoma cruzi Dm28c TaxID=1416333 RepID=V5B6D0_TRYCR|nr:trans-sialidase [Trypanosoma cruzi Dm28c]
MNEAKKYTQVLEEGTSPHSKKVDVSRPRTVVNGSDIYMLAGKYSRTAATNLQERCAGDWGLLLVEGEVSSEESGSNKKIQWDKNQRLAGTFPEAERDSLMQLVAGGGSGVQTDDGTLVFPVEGTKKKGEAQNDEKAVSLLIYSSDNAASWTLSKGMSDDGCSDPSVVEWEKDKKLMMMTACDDGRRRVYESGDKGESWTEALGTLSRVWGNKQDEGAKAVRSGFITATIDGEDNRNVMLVTLPVYPKEADKKETGNGKGALHLWLTDNTHIVDIGPVSDDDDAAASSLLYKSGKSEDSDNEQKEELIALYEKKKDGEESSHSLWYVPLTEQLQRVKDVLLTWKKADDRVSKLCPSSAEEDASPGNVCSPTAGKITDGLVGFLSGNFSENTWRDEYLGVNATVKGNEGGKKATLHEGSVTFHGAWAEWPVGEQGENQLYHFANYNFTLVVTVSIDKVPKEEEGSPIPLMGVSAGSDGGKNLMELSYETGKKWKVLCGKETPKELSSTSEETTHHVVILLRNGTQGSAYVDGQPVLGGAQCDLGNTKDKKIPHFYIGGDGGAKGVSEVQDVSVTVTNVLLYNRPLNSDEIAGISKNKITNPKREGPKTSTSSLSPAASGSVAQQTVSLPTPAGQQQTEQYPLKKSKDAGGVGVSTSRETTVANPLPGLESVQQLASVKSSDGTQSVNAASSSVGDKTVGRAAGDETQNDETHQPSMNTSDTADANTPTAKGVGHDGTVMDQERNASSREDEEVAGGTDGQEAIHAQQGEVNATALSSFGNVSQGNNTDAGTVRGSGLLPSLPLLLGLWVFAAL